MVRGNSRINSAAGVGCTSAAHRKLLAQLVAPSGWVELALDTVSVSASESRPPGGAPGIGGRVEAGYEVEITRRRKLVARLVPPEEDDRVEFPDFDAPARSVWGERWEGSSSGALLDEGRGKR